MNHKIFTMKIVKTSEFGNITWFSKFKHINNKRDVFEVMLHAMFYGASFALLERIFGDDELRTNSAIIGEKIVRFVESNLAFGAIYSEIMKCHSSSDHDTDDLLDCIAAQATADSELSKFNDEIIENDIHDIDEIDEIFITKYARPRIYRYVYGVRPKSN